MCRRLGAPPSCASRRRSGTRATGEEPGPSSTWGDGGTTPFVLWATSSAASPVSARGEPCSGATPRSPTWYFGGSAASRQPSRSNRQRNGWSVMRGSLVMRWHCMRLIPASDAHALQRCWGNSRFALGPRTPSGRPLGPAWEGISNAAGGSPAKITAPAATQAHRGWEALSSSPGAAGPGLRPHSVHLVLSDAIPVSHPASIPCVPGSRPGPRA